MIRGPCASHPINATFVTLDSANATPSVWEASYSSCPEKSNSCPVEILLCPVCVHLVSLMPSRESLYLVISPATCAVLPVWYMALTFHVPILMCLVERKVLSPVASVFLRLSPHGVISHRDEDPSSSRLEFFVISAFNVYVARIF